MFRLPIEKRAKKYLKLKNPIIVKPILFALFKIRSVVLDYYTN